LSRSINHAVYCEEVDGCIVVDGWIWTQAAEEDEGRPQAQRRGREKSQRRQRGVAQKEEKGVQVRRGGNQPPETRSFEVHASVSTNAVLCALERVVERAIAWSEGNGGTVAG